MPPVSVVRVDPVGPDRLVARAVELRSLDEPTVDPPGEGHLGLAVAGPNPRRATHVDATRCVDVVPPLALEAVGNLVAVAGAHERAGLVVRDVAVQIIVAVGSDVPGLEPVLEDLVGASRIAADDGALVGAAHPTGRGDPVQVLVAVLLDDPGGRVFGLLLASLAEVNQGPPPSPGLSGS